MEETRTDVVGPLPSPVDELKARCKEAGIELVEEQDETRGIIRRTVHIKSGRGKRVLRVSNDNDARELLSIPFEHLTPLGDYAAYLDKENGFIEAIFRPLRRFYGYQWEKYLFAGSSSKESDDRSQLRVEIRSSTPNKAIVISQPSQVAMILSGHDRIRQLGLSMRIEGVQTKWHDPAVDILKRVADSFFFQIELLRGTALSLLKSNYRARGNRPRAIRGSTGELHFPKFEYDEQPMALYWYARSAVGMPLLQYLAYYQSLEFFFPIYSQADAQRRVRHMLKDPGFHPDREGDLSKLIAAARTSNGKPFGDERGQLRSTISECVAQEILREFLSVDQPRKEFFTSKAKKLGLDPLPIDRGEVDMRAEVATRIYNIRCKIAHTKSGGDGEVDLLLPFSEEAESLGHDVELIQFVSQRVLIASSRSLTDLTQLEEPQSS